MIDEIGTDDNSSGEAQGSSAPTTILSLTFVPGATGPLPSHNPVPGAPPKTVDIPPITIKFAGGVVRTWTRMQVSRDTGLSLTTVSKLFTGSRKPSFRTAKLLAAYFGVTLERLSLEILPRWESRLIRRPRYIRPAAE